MPRHASSPRPRRLCVRRMRARQRLQARSHSQISAVSMKFRPYSSHAAFICSCASASVFWLPLQAAVRRRRRHACVGACSALLLAQSRSQAARTRTSARTASRTTSSCPDSTWTPGGRWSPAARAPPPRAWCRWRRRPPPASAACQCAGCVGLLHVLGRPGDGRGPGRTLLLLGRALERKFAWLSEVGAACGRSRNDQGTTMPRLNGASWWCKALQGCQCRAGQCQAIIKRADQLRTDLLV